ncbi:MAG TPA: STAS domain-containing protein [Trebonia sp.]|nr:STAS domain-containing protein [Trebonia sp.]
MTLENESNVGTALVTPASGTERKLSTVAGIRIITDGPGPVSAVVTGELDLACVRALTNALCEAVDAHPAGVCVDLTNVDFCGCCAVRSLLTARTFAVDLGREFAIGSQSQTVARVLELTNARSLLTAQQ